MRNSFNTLPLHRIAISCLMTILLGTTVCSGEGEPSSNIRRGIPPVMEPRRPFRPREPRDPEARENSYGYLGRLLDRKIGELDWGHGARVAFHAVDLVHHVPVCDHDADLPLPPASLMKLFLTAAALKALGPDYRFTTEFLAAGEIKKAKLKGDWLRSRYLKGGIWVRGEGDPSWSVNPGEPLESVYATLDEWAKELRKRRIHAVEGPLTLDLTAFDERPYPIGWPDEEVGSPYIPEISALNFNDNCFDIMWNPTRKFERRIATYTLFPPLPKFIHFSNNIRVESGRDADRRFTRRPGSNVVSGEGHVPANFRGHDRVTVAHPAEYFAAALIARFAINDVKLAERVTQGEMPVADAHEERDQDWLKAKDKDEIEKAERDRDRDWDRDKNAPLLELRLERKSPPLSEIISRMLKWDRTLDAEVILKTIGRKATGQPGSFENGTRAVMRYIRDQKIVGSSFVMADGSGMSNINRASPRQTMLIMDRLLYGSNGEWLKEAFASCGEPGPMESRMRMGVDMQSQNRPEVRAIGGSFGTLHTMAGWANTRAGHPIHFVFMVSNSRLSAPEIAQRMDAVILEITRSLIQ